MLHRVLGGDNQKRLGEREGVGIHRDLAFVHRFEQRRLGFGSSAIDFVRENDVGKDRSALELKLMLDGGINRDAEYIAGQHVAGELDALKAAIDGTGQCLTESGLSHARDAFDQEVSAGEDRNEGEAKYVIFTADDLLQAGFELHGAA